MQAVFMDQTGMVTIYALCEPDTRTVRYVGKAIDLPARIRSHNWETRNPKLHTRKVNWLRSLNGASPVVKVLCLVSQDSWQEAERFWIAEMRGRGCDLTNYADGGQTSPVEGKGHTEATKAKLRAIALASGRAPPSHKGLVHSDQARLKMSAASKRRGATPPPNGGWNKGVQKSHCPNGHEYTPDNIYVVTKKSDGGRTYNQCRRCAALQQQQFQQRRKAAKAGVK